MNGEQVAEFVYAIDAATFHLKRIADVLEKDHAARVSKEDRDEPKKVRPE